MTQDKTALLPCPFCGGADAFVERADFVSSYAVCNSCSARGPIGEEVRDDEGRAAAIAAWNRRSDAPFKVEVERLRETLDEIGGLSRFLRQGGPDTMDLEGLSDGLSRAVDMAHAALLPEGLAPCPFCGSNGARLHENASAAMAWVACLACGLEAPSETGTDRRAAISYWNTRPAAGAREVYGPHGWLNGHRGLSEDSWELESDPLENSEEYFAIPLYALVDPFKEIGKDGPAALRSIPPDDGSITDAQQRDPASPSTPTGGSVNGQLHRTQNE